MRRNDDSSEHKFPTEHKFPNYLHHVLPEDDPLATRTLFAGNLVCDITEEELSRIFGMYGTVKEVNIKKPPLGTGSAVGSVFAFIRFHTLDMAYRAKVALSGQYIGKYQCKIGYGKAIPTRRIWVGGLGPWTSIPQLEREFDRFGAIKKLEYAKGDIQAYISYDSIDAAKTAVKEMRGFPLGAPDRRLRIDYADVIPGVTNYRPNHLYYPHVQVVDYHRASSSEQRVGSRDEWGRSWTEPSYEHYRHSGSRSVDRSRSRSPRRSPDSDLDSGSRRVGPLASSRTLQEVARKCTTIWQGALILRNSLFPAKFHLIDGDLDIVEGLMNDKDSKHQLCITQRLRLDQPKLKAVQKRISIASSYAIFLGLAGSTALFSNDDSSVQTRPLRNLVSYLERKEAAGVISLLNNETEASGVLYSFPPCAFSTKLLKRTCPNLYDEAISDDHLVIVVLRGVTA